MTRTPGLALIAVLCGVGGTAAGAPAGAQLPAPVTAQIQHVLDEYLAQRGKAEGISGVSLYVSLGDPGPAIEAFAGNDGRDDKAPINGDTLFQIGSNTKHFEAAVILKLEADGKLNIGQTLGEWLPEYPAWKSVTIRQLLNMTSPIPAYSDTLGVGAAMGKDPNHQFTNRELIRSVYPRPDNQLPTPDGYFYSNTNNILAALIIEKASGKSFKAWLEKTIFPEVGLYNTYYSEGMYPEKVLARVPRGLYMNAECLDYQPKPCKESLIAPLIGRDMSRMNMSWAGAAGAIVSNPRDLTKWVRALFGGRVIPQQQLDEMMTTVSMKTGKNIAHATEGDSQAFGLDLGQGYNRDTGGTYWFYEGITLGFRAIFAYWPQYDLVITTATNSQPPHGENRLGADVLTGTFQILNRAGVIRQRPTGTAAAATGSRG
jgi:D-alanyl-D-alanine carboxypeptidase